MNRRQRLAKLLAGEAVEPRLTLSWPGRSEESDLTVLTLEEIGVGGPLPAHTTLVEIANPFGRALAQGLRLPTLLEEEPQAGERALRRFADETRAAMREALQHGAEGFLYRLHGAHPSFATPMQYGGHFLEIDRELLQEFDGSIRLVFVVGGEGAYLDVVSDLPADLFGWDVRATGVPVEQVRRLRPGPLVAASPDADVILTHPGDVSPLIENQPLSSHA